MTQFLMNDVEMGNVTEAQIPIKNISVDTFSFHVLVFTN